MFLSAFRNDAHFAQHDYLIRETVMSLHAAAAGSQEHVQNYSASHPYAHNPFSQPQLNFYPPTAGSPHHPLAQPPYGGSHLYGNTGNHHSDDLPENLSGNKTDQSKNPDGLKEPKLPQQQVQMPPTQEYDVNSYSDKYVANQSASLKETQKSPSSLSPSSQDHFSHHFKNEHLNTKTSQYLTQEKFDAHRNLNQDFRDNQSADEAENLTKPSTEQSGVRPSVATNPDDQMSSESNKNCLKVCLLFPQKTDRTRWNKLAPCQPINIQTLRFPGNHSKSQWLMARKFLPLLQIEPTLLVSTEIRSQSHLLVNCRQQHRSQTPSSRRTSPLPPRANAPWR